ncbi:hypothetical protein A2635_05610 [Candidatus Peribacteria bacterium RIFCSPHIGHO2_01_FULL_51_9]|nr:MAG: hypothetical protein A2635_05610 [Candidatus Peribacteria bacterium RIFCSPHIGHO2_01_FULL_51_9]
MRLFLIGLANLVPEQIDVARMLKKNHEIRYWVRITDHFKLDAAEFSGTVFHEYQGALRARGAPGIAITDFDPWSPGQIATYAAVESEFMSMADKVYPQWPVNQRKELYHDMLRYWGGVLEKFSPDAIIFQSVPHQLFDFVLYEIARRRHLRTLILDSIWQDERYQLIEDYREGSGALARSRDGDRRGSLDDLSPEMRAYYLDHKESSNPVPLSMSVFLKTHTLRHNLRRLLHVSARFIRDGTIFERAALKIVKMMKSSMLDEYRAHQCPVDLAALFVYFPLHYQPELTTSPLAGVFVDQVLAIKILAAALPDGWELYVKEHPAQMGVHGGNPTPARYRGFYKAIAEVPRVRLIPISTNTFELCDSAKTTATLTGTAAWESILRGKAALVFGYPWFMHAPGILRVESVEDCQRALHTIIEGFAPSEADISKYLHAIEHTTVKDNPQARTPGRAYDTKAMYHAIENALAS